MLIDLLMGFSQYHKCHMAQWFSVTGEYLKHLGNFLKSH